MEVKYAAVKPIPETFGNEGLVLLEAKGGQCSWPDTKVSYTRLAESGSSYDNWPYSVLDQSCELDSFSKRYNQSAGNGKLIDSLAKAKQVDIKIVYKQLTTGDLTYDNWPYGEDNDYEEGRSIESLSRKRQIFGNPGAGHGKRFGDSTVDEPGLANSSY